MEWNLRGNQFILILPLAMAQGLSIPMTQERERLSLDQHRSAPQHIRRPIVATIQEIPPIHTPFSQLLLSVLFVIIAIPISLFPFFSVTHY